MENCRWPRTADGQLDPQRPLLMWRITRTPQFVVDGQIRAWAQRAAQVHHNAQLMATEAIQMAPGAWGEGDGGGGGDGGGDVEMADA